MATKKSFLEDLFERALLKLGPIAQFIPVIAKSIKKSLSDGDIVKVEGYITELEEAAAALTGIAAHFRLAVADGSLDLEEGAVAALKIERFLDELEDVAKGRDEDDATA